MNSLNNINTLNESEKIKFLINILIQRATGKISYDDIEANNSYEIIRKFLFSKKEYINFIPSFIKVHRTLDSFWDFIKEEFDKYAERRRYINQEFTPLQDYIDNIIVDKKEEEAMNNTSDTTNSIQIFISHSSIDTEYAKLLVWLLKDFGISQNRILCTSVPETSIQIGTADFFEYLKENLVNSTLFICLFSQNYLNSPMCLCEMGAAWIISKKQILVLTPETDFSLSSNTVLGRVQGLKLDDRTKILQLFEVLKKNFHLSTDFMGATMAIERYFAGIDIIKKKQ